MADKKLAVHTPGWVNDFKAFIMRGNVVDMAVGVIIGAAFTAIVNSLVKDVFNPVLGLATGGIDFSNLFVTLKGPVEPTLDAAQKAGAVTLNYGVFINAVIQFLIVAIVIFWMVRLLSKLHTKQAEEPVAPPPPTKSELLLQDIRDAIVHQQTHS
ncbi:large conductance mechanosensitive channel protein MscL [Acetobacter sicerae]|uniref:Large-conductance mechanosensitive channel n=1 Tax=Acetobacter sicerae TaxID=85325 RepID=A0ABS8VZ92_9PROT|nr:large conductance mechanosensitive channel protein MscL [Acetobacter sicerae]MCE0745511.1 large conductance mechanosensitive channel protein MscL [Acetobacter sicerae]NHN90633.1 large conductance mechanosensitive channel protein MscL [Acetobacter sicerae]